MAHCYHQLVGVLRTIIIIKSLQRLIGLTWVAKVNTSVRRGWMVAMSLLAQFWVGIELDIHVLLRKTLKCNGHLLMYILSIFAFFLHM